MERSLMDKNRQRDRQQTREECTDSMPCVFGGRAMEQLSPTCGWTTAIPPPFQPVGSFNSRLLFIPDVFDLVRPTHPLTPSLKQGRGIERLSSASARRDRRDGRVGAAGWGAAAVARVARESAANGCAIAGAAEPAATGWVFQTGVSGGIFDRVAAIGIEDDPIGVISLLAAPGIASCQPA